MKKAYEFTEAETRKGSATIVGWVEYTVIGEDGVTKLTNCEKITVTLK